MAGEARPRAGGDPLRLLLGSIVAASHRVEQAAGNGGRTSDATSQEPDLLYVALGAACVAEDRLVDASRALFQAAQVLGRPVEAAARSLLPGAVKQRVGRAVCELDAYGRSAVSTGSRKAVGIAESLADEVVNDPAVVGIIEQVVDRLQWRVVDDVLPVVLDRLRAEPEPVREIVRGQSRGAAGEVANAARARAAGGDEAVDALVSRLLHRRSARRAVPEDSAPLPLT